MACTMSRKAWPSTAQRAWTTAHSLPITRTRQRQRPEGSQPFAADSRSRSGLTGARELPAAQLGEDDHENAADCTLHDVAFAPCVRGSDAFRRAGGGANANESAAAIEGSALREMPQRDLTEIRAARRTIESRPEVPRAAIYILQPD